jgi:hypothetical protein
MEDTRSDPRGQIAGLPTVRQLAVSLLPGFSRADVPHQMRRGTVLAGNDGAPHVPRRPLLQRTANGRSRGLDKVSHLHSTTSASLRKSSLARYKLSCSIMSV